MARHERRRSGWVEGLEGRLLLSATQVVRNGGFEGVVTPSDWSLSGAFQADSRFGTMRSGAGYAYVAMPDGASGNGLNGSMYQQLAIPANANSLTFSFWTRITTAETGTTAKDVMSVRVMDATGTSVLQNLVTLSNLDKNTGYVQKTFSLARSLIGQTVRIQFDAATDSANATTFRVDDVGLNAVATENTNRVVGYLPQYRYSSFSKTDLTALTHINYFSVSIASANDGSLSTGGVTAANLDTVVAAAHAAGVTVSITVGPVSFSTVAGSATARAKFANDIVNYALGHNLDGVDIDWEPPAGNAVPNYGLLINDLYTVAHPQHLLITAAVNPWTNEIPAANVNAKMDWLNVMCYDFQPANHANWADSISGLTDWTQYGVAKNKIVMGLPFYARSGTSWSNTQSLTYASVVAGYKSKYGVDLPASADSYVDGSGVTWYFNGVNTIERKTAYVRDNGYGGVMTWELGQDSWDASGKYTAQSLLPAMKSVMRPPAWVSADAGSQFDLVAGTLYVHAGNVNLIGDAGGVNVKVVAGSVSVGTTQHLGDLAVAAGATFSLTGGGNKVLVVKSLSDLGGKLDLADDGMVIDYAGATPSAQVVAWLSGGRNSGTWTGNGIRSSVAAADSAKLTGIGWAEAAQLGRTSFAGQAIDTTALVLKYTYYGDTDLNGTVDADDLARVDRGMAKGVVSWLGGDFNYTQTLTTNDAAMASKSFATGGPVIADPEGTVIATAAAAPVGLAEERSAPIVKKVKRATLARRAWLAMRAYRLAQNVRLLHHAR